MKKALLVLLVAVNAQAIVGKKITPDTTSLVGPEYMNRWNELSHIETGVFGPKRVCMFNSTGSVIAFTSSPAWTVATSLVYFGPDEAVSDIYVPVSTGRCADIQMQGALYLRVDSDNSLDAGNIYYDINDIY